MGPTILAAAAPVGEGVKSMLTAEMLSPITTAVTSNLTTLVPIGIGIMGAMIGVSLIPRIVYKFL